MNAGRRGGRGTWCALALIATASGACLAQAGTTIYTSKSQWISATRAQTTAVTFEEAFWPADQVLGGDWTLNGVKFRGRAGTIGGLGSAFFPNIYVFTLSPLTGRALTANGDEDIDITPLTSRTALAFDLAVNPFGPVTVSVYDTSGSLVSQTQFAPGSLGFCGVASSNPIGRVNFRSVNGAIQNSYLDNVSLADALVACGADFNQDGFLDFTDFDAFVAAFEAGDPASDFNGDGFIDFTDFDAFVSAFEAGC